MTATTEAEALERRAVAIEESGWGRAFVWWQPRNAASWTYVVLSIAGLWGLWRTIGQVSYAYEGALVLAIVVSAVVTFVIGWFLFHLDRFGTVPPGLAVVAFVWGAVPASGAIAIWANDAVLSLWAKGFGPVFAANWGAALTAPIDEELAKGMGIVLLIALAPRLIRSAYDGLLVGALIGLGFQVLEDILYAVNSAAAAFGADQVANGGRTIAVRVATAIPSHWMFSGIFGAGLVWFLGRPDFPPRRILGVTCMLTAMLAHGLWDAVSGFGSISPVLASIMPIVLTAGLILVFIRIYRVAAAGEGNWMRDILTPELTDGIVDGTVLTAIAGNRHTRKRFIRGLPRAMRRRARHDLDATTELGLRLAKDSGRDTPQVEHLRSELRRLRGPTSTAPATPPLSGDLKR